MNDPLPMTVREQLLVGQATQQELLHSLIKTMGEMDQHWQMEFKRLEASVILADAKAEASKTILASFKTQGATVLTIVGLLGATIGAVITAKASGMAAAVMAWMMAAPK